MKGDIASYLERYCRMAERLSVIFPISLAAQQLLTRSVWTLCGVELAWSNPMGPHAWCSCREEHISVTDDIVALTLSRSALHS